MKAIDLFAGSGGFTEGARLAGNVEVVWAANHWQTAVNTHWVNHPDAMHVCQDLQQADWSKVPECDLVLASPCCQGHSHARGKDRPQHDSSRSTAWAVVSCCEYHTPAAFIVENVPEFLNWKLYPAWAAAMEALGYHLTATTINAADTGVPQHRQRVFIVGSRRAPVTIAAPQEEHQAIAPVIDWDFPKWSPVEKKNRAQATLDRIANGRKTYGDRFVMSYYGNSHNGRSLDRPLGTVTTRDRWAVVDGDRMRMLSPDEYKAAMGFRQDYQLAGNRATQIHLLGNAVCPPVAAHVVSETVTSLN